MEVVVHRFEVDSREHGEELVQEWMTSSEGVWFLEHSLRPLKIFKTHFGIPLSFTHNKQWTYTIRAELQDAELTAWLLKHESHKNIKQKRV